jgi:hypothetical protein
MPPACRGGDWLQAPIAWQAGEWHLITLTYSSDASVLFLDGERVGAGKGPPAWLVAAAGSENVFCIGGDADGDNLAQGQFDEVATFGYPLTDTEVKRYFQKLWPTVQLGPITPEEKQDEAAAWAMEIYPTPNDAEQEEGEQFPFGAAAYGCGLWLEISATNDLATLTLHNTRSNAFYQILTNADLTTTNWSVFLTNTADGSGYRTWTNIAIDLWTNLFFRACEARDYM